MNNKNISLYDALVKAGAEVKEEQKAFLNALDESLKARQADSDESLSSSMKAAIAEALGALEKDEAGKVIPIATKLKDIAEALEKIEKQQTQVLSDKAKYQLAKFVKENHAAIVDAVKNGKDFEEFTFKAAAAFTTTNAMTNGTGVGLPLVENYLVENDIAVIRHPENFILEAIPNRQVAKVPQQVIRTEQATEEGAVAVVAEGGTKPLVSDTFIRNTTPRKKYAGRIEWSEEFEMDNEMLFAEIVRMFEDKVIRAWQDGIITTIQTNATAYTTSVLDDTFPVPDNALAVIAAQSVIQGMYFMPNTVIMNPSDLFATLFTQDTEGRPLLKSYIADGRINGMRVFSSYKIAQGTALVGDATVYQEWHSDYIFRVGTYNDQFIKNQKTAIGEVFSLLRIANNEKPAWMVLNLATVKASLQKPAA